jgi:molybdate transport system substrate-binding protein
MKVLSRQILKQLHFLLLCILTALCTNAFAGQVTVAVTNNFDYTAVELKTQFEAISGHTVNLIPGPSSAHYNRILQGEGFDIFLSDDSERPGILEANAHGTRFTYASAKLVLWSVDNRRLTPDLLTEKDFHLLAITNPRLSPFGKAAQEVLEKLDAWEGIQDKLVIGENIGHTYQLAISGDVDLALIAYSQIVYGMYMQAGSHWQIPDTYYTPMEHQGVLLTDNPAAQEFIQFMQSTRGQQIILGNGYLVP